MAAEIIELRSLTKPERIQTPASQSGIMTGIEAFDKVLGLKFDQFAVLGGEGSRSLAFLLCIRATLPHPLGPDSDVIFVDGDNTFDPYLISEYSVEHELHPENSLERIHISRAFTYHQLASLITEKLPAALKQFHAKLVIVSNITQLYCDPDVRNEDKQEALRIFEKTVKFLRSLAEDEHALIVATDLQPRNPRMSSILMESAHVFAELDDEDSYTRLRLLKPPWIRPISVMHSSVNGNQILDRYL